MREFLKGLELDSELVDKIMAEHGKYLTKLKEQVDEYQTKETEYQTKIKDYDTKISELNNTIESKSKELENLSNVTNENRDLKAKIQMSDSNVKKEFSKFVTSEVMAKVDDKHDFASVLEDYKKENPQYFGESVVNKVQTSPNLNGGNTNQPQTTNSIMNNLLRNGTNE